MGNICTKLPKTRVQAQQVINARKASAANTSIPPPTGTTAKQSEEVNKREEAARQETAATPPSINELDSVSADHEVEYSLCKSADLEEKQMKTFNAGERPVLLVKEKGQVYAMGAKCTHFGAPLDTGIYCKGKVYCPWHGACFNSKSGDIEEFPGLDPIPVYPVTVDPVTDEVKVKVTPSKLLTSYNGVSRPLATVDEDNKEIVLIIGSGAAGHSCAETLRQEGYRGRVVIVTKEKYIPYDRTKLSKAMVLDQVKLALRSEEYYRKGDIDIICEVTVKAVDVEAKSVLLSTGESLGFSHLVIATGGRPRPVPCPGTHLTNVFLLRTPDDANQIDAAVNKECHVVIIGASFIGMEVAAYLVDKAASVTVVERADIPFVHIFGPLIGKRLQQQHEEKGVKFVMGIGLAELVGDEEGKLTEVSLTSGDSLRADLVVAGIGVLPSTDFLRGSDITLDMQGYVPVDEFMRTNIENIYAAGDIASFPLVLKPEDGSRQLVSIGHWQMALHHGRTAALTILGRSQPIYETAVPFFWSSMFGKSIRYCGYARHFDDVVIHGDLEGLKFVAFLCDGEVVRAIVTLGFDPLAVQYSALLRQGKQLMKVDILSDPKSWTRLLDDASIE